MSLNFFKSLALLFLTFVRFSSKVPVIIIDDSVKYFLPLKFVNNQYTIPYVLEGLNFSLFNKAISAFFQSIFAGGLTELIVFQKLLGLASTVLVYLILNKQYKVNERLALIAAFVFSLNPFMLYIEQSVMPETYFIFFSLVAVYLFNLILSEDNNKKQMLLIFAFGSTISLISTIKETANYWNLCIIIALAIFLIAKQYKNQLTNLTLTLLILITSSQIFTLPSRIYHLQKFDKASVSLFSTKGVILYSLSQEMLQKPAPKGLDYIQRVILQVRNQNLQRFQAESKELNEHDRELAYTAAISKVNTIGREGKLLNPKTQKAFSSHEWSDLCIEFAIKKSLQSPFLFAKRILTVSFPNLFFNENYTLQYTRKSLRPALDLEVMQFAKAPFSFKSQIDPALKDAKIIDASEINKILSTARLSRPILIMTNRSGNTAYKLSSNSISLKLQEILKDFAYGKILLILFTFLLGFFLIKEKNLFSTDKLKILFPTLSSLFFILFPLMIAICEARYRLQFEHFMLISTVVLWQYYSNHLSKVKK